MAEKGWTSDDWRGRSFFRRPHQSPPNTRIQVRGQRYSIGVDSVGNPIAPPPNLAALKFREEEGAFLVGALAALVSKTKKLGFVGGMNFPLIHKFEAGYRAGIKHVCSQCTIISQYAGVTPEAFRNPGRGKELALSQYQQGVDIIYHGGVHRPRRLRSRTGKTEIRLGRGGQFRKRWPHSHIEVKGGTSPCSSGHVGERGDLSRRRVPARLEEQAWVCLTTTTTARYPAEIRARVECSARAVIAGKIGCEQLCRLSRSTSRSVPYGTIVGHLWMCGWRDQASSRERRGEST